MEIVVWPSYQITKLLYSDTYLRSCVLIVSVAAILILRTAVRWYEVWNRKMKCQTTVKIRKFFGTSDHAPSSEWFPKVPRSALAPVKIQNGRHTYYKDTTSQVGLTVISYL